MQGAKRSRQISDSNFSSRLKHAILLKHAIDLFAQIVIQIPQHSLNCTDTMLASRSVRRIKRYTSWNCHTDASANSSVLRHKFFCFLEHINHHADRFTIGTNRDERVQTNGRLSYKISLRRKHTTMHGEVSRRLLPEFKTVYQSVLEPSFKHK